jgi:hypothetical protein
MSAYGAAAQSDRAEIAAAIRRVVAADFTLDAEPSAAATPAPIESLQRAIDAEVTDELPPLTIPEGDSEESMADAPVATPQSAVDVTAPAPGLGAIYTLEDDEEDEEFVIPPPEPTHKAQARVARQQQKARRTAADLDAKVTTISGVGAATAACASNTSYAMTPVAVANVRTIGSDITGRFLCFGAAGGWRRRLTASLQRRAHHLKDLRNIVTGNDAQHLLLRRHRHDATARTAHQLPYAGEIAVGRVTRNGGGGRHHIHNPRFRPELAQAIDQSLPRQHADKLPCQITHREIGLVRVHD